MSYLELLRKLLALGPQLPAILAKLKALAVIAKEIADLLGLSIPAVLSALSAPSLFGSDAASDPSDVAAAEQALEAASPGALEALQSLK